MAAFPARPGLSALMTMLLIFQGSCHLSAGGPANSCALSIVAAEGTGARDGGRLSWTDNTSQVELLSQDLTVKLYPDTHCISVEGQLRFRSNYDLNQVTFWLHQMLNLRRFEQNGQPLNFSRNAYSDMIAVNFEPMLQKGQVLTLDVSYEGTMWVLEDGARQDCVGPEGAYVKGSTHWYIMHHTSDWADYRLKLCCPPNWTGVADGELEVEEHTPGWANYTWVTDKPCMRPAFAACDYTVNGKTAGGVNITCYTFPEDNASAQRYIDEAASVLAAYSSLLGPYERKSFKIVETDHQTMTGYACSGFVMLYPGAFRGGAFNYNLLSHEMGHEWFPFATGYTGWAYPWLWEAFPEYLSCIYEIDRYGVRDRLERDRNAFLQVHDDARQKCIRATNWDDPLSYPVLYAKGAWVVHMLRGMMGDAAFFSTLRDYVDGNRYAMGSAEIFIATTKAHTSVPVVDFFQQWLNTTNDLDVSLPAARQYDNGTSFYLELEPQNLLCATNPTDIGIEYSDGTSKTVRLGWDGKERLVCLPARSPVYKVRLDPDGWLLDIERDNNAAMPVSSGKIFDLQLVCLNISGETIEGRQTAFAATVRNNSSYEATGVVLDFLMDGLLFENQTLALAAGREDVLTANWVPSLGRHTLTARLDPKDAIHEWNEANNNASLKLEVMPPPPRLDLCVDNLSVEPSGMMVDDRATFTANISNLGEVAVGQFSVQFLLDREHLESFSVQELSPGASRTLSAHWIADKGFHNVSVVVDPLGVINDSDRRNDRAELAFFVSWPLGLRLRMAPESPAPMETVTFTYSGVYGVELLLDFGDGINTGWTAEGERFSTAYHTYYRAGAYTVELRGRSDGMEEQIRLQLNVTDRPLGLRLLANATMALTLVPVLFTALVENRTEVLVVARWDFGDGIRANGGYQQEHRYRRAGPYRVNCTVIDADGATASATMAIVVQDRPPQVRWEGSQKLRTGVRAAFVANGSDPDGNITVYNWSFGDGGNATGAAVEHVFRRPGRFLVSISAVDDTGSNASFEAWVVVEQSATPATPWPTWPLWLALVAGLAVAGVFLLRRWNRRRDRDYDEFFSGRD